MYGIRPVIWNWNMRWCCLRQLFLMRNLRSIGRIYHTIGILQTGNYKDSIGRSYYAMFSAVRAILALDGVDYSKHAAVIAYFQKEYVKTGKESVIVYK